jgi:hypothetical protein
MGKGIPIVKVEVEFDKPAVHVTGIYNMGLHKQGWVDMREDSVIVSGR